MELPCRQELTLIETDTLDEALDTYLRKHRYVDNVDYFVMTLLQRDCDYQVLRRVPQQGATGVVSSDTGARAYERKRLRSNFIFRN